MWDILPPGTRGPDVFRAARMLERVMSYQGPPKPELSFQHVLKRVAEVAWPEFVIRDPVSTLGPAHV